MTILPKRAPEHVPIGRLGLIEGKYFIEHRLNAVRSRSRGTSLLTSGLPARDLYYFVRGGGLISYGADLIDEYRRAAMHLQVCIDMGGRRPMQIVLIVVAIAAAILFDIRPSGAYEGPWCAGTNRGGGTFVYNCSMRTLEQCVSEVIAGNRGFCNPNPYYRGLEASPPRGKRKRHYY